MPWNAFPAVTKGDRLMLITHRPEGDLPVIVTRVGRDYVYVSRDGSETEMRSRFDRRTGIEDSRIGYKQELLTQEQYEERAHRRALLHQLRQAGIEVSARREQTLSTNQLRKLLAVVQDDAREQAS
jgi:hypothetical protein